MKLLTWQNGILVGIIIFFLMMHLNVISGLEQLPGPLYGGDVYHQLGAVNHVKYGGNPLVNFHNSDPIPDYYPVYSAIVGGSARMFNLDAMDAIFLFALIFLVSSIIILYCLGNVVFKNKSISLLLPLIFYSLLPFKLIIKYTYFTYMILFPLFFLFLFSSISKKEPNKQYMFAFATSILYGLCSLSHGIMFPTLTIFMFILFIYLFIFKYLEKNKINMVKWKADFKRNFIAFSLLTIPGFLIAQIHWRYIISSVLLNAESSASILEGMNVPLQYSLLSNLSGFIFNFSSLTSAFITSLFLVSVVLVFILRKHREIINNLVLLLFGMFFIIVLFPIMSFVSKIDFTMLLIRVIDSFWLPLIISLFATFSLYYSFKLVKIKDNRIFYVLFVVVLAFLLMGNYSIYKGYKSDDRWYEAGTHPLSAYVVTVSDYINENTDVNDVILTNKELAFSVNALTGRKFVAHPVGHKTQIYDFNTRERDLAIMLYGNDSGKRCELFEKYNVKYLYWEYSWIQNEFRFDEQGKIIGLYDPIEILNTRENKEILTKYNVLYQEVNLELNPNKRGYVRKYDVLLVFPNFNLTHPWSSSLDKHLELAKTFDYQGQDVAKIYQVI